MKSVKFRYLFKIYAAVVAYICTFMIYPAHDDFGYTAPKLGLNLPEQLMSTATFWRPFDRLIEYGLGYAPYLYPYVNHFMVLAGHFLLCLLLYVVLKKLTGDKNYSLIGAFYFCLSPCIVCTVTNLDFINQVWAITTGMAATFFFFRAAYDWQKRISSTVAFIGFCGDIGQGERHCMAQLAEESR